MTDMAVVVTTMLVALFFVAIAIWFYVRGQHTRSGRAFERFVGRILTTIFLGAIAWQALRGAGAYLAAHPEAKTVAWSVVAAAVALAVGSLLISLAWRFRRFFWYGAAAAFALVSWSWVAGAVVVAFCLLAELILAIRQLASAIERSRQAASEPKD